MATEIQKNNHTVKLHILYPFTDKPWGGGNQFLHILKNAFISRGMYVDNAQDANIVLVNNYHELLPALVLKWKKPWIAIIHRLGPILSYHRRAYWRLIDWLVIRFTNLIASAAVFQSEWAFQEGKKLGCKTSIRYRVVHNTVDPRLFYPPRNKIFNSKKVRLIATSWSANPNKGFDYYQFLDTHLDFSRFQMTFIGNSPVRFKNIIQLSPLSSARLAEQLREHDIYITATKDDACSNAIIEALSTGLPVVALASGGNGELIKDGGALFYKQEDIFKAISSVANNFEQYRKNIAAPARESIVSAYESSIQEALLHPPTVTAIHMRMRVVLLYTVACIFRTVVLGLDKILSLKI